MKTPRHLPVTVTVATAALLTGILAQSGARIGLPALASVFFAAGLTGWLITKTTMLERAILIAAGLVLVYPSFIQDGIGIGLFGLAGFLQYRRHNALAVRPDQKQS